MMGLQMGLVRGVGFEPTKAYATGYPLRPPLTPILSPAPLSWLGNLR